MSMGQAAYRRNALSAGLVRVYVRRLSGLSAWTRPAATHSRHRFELCDSSDGGRKKDKCTVMSWTNSAPPRSRRPGWRWHASWDLGLRSASHFHTLRRDIEEGLQLGATSAPHPSPGTRGVS
jgi:hypothetical protein